MSHMTVHIGRVLGGRYRLLSPLGSGASAHVYLADDVRLRRRVAVKVLHPALADDESFLRRFRAEARAAAALSHPHLLAVYDWSEDDEGRPFLVTEHLAGGTLRAMLDAGHRLSPAQALVVGLEAARGLDHAHARGFVHRDVKPANLLFGADGRLRVADFGLARAIAEAGWTEPGDTVLGTVRYASPEQARGETLDGRSDVYSLALLLVEAVTGRLPFTADTTIGTLMARLDHSLVAPDALGPLAPVVSGAGRLDRGERLDAGAFARDLVEVAGELSRPAPLPLGTPGPAALVVDAGHDATLLGPGARPPVVARTPAAPAPAPVTPAPAPAGPATTAVGTAVDGLSRNDRSARRLMLGAAVVAVAVAVGVVGGWLYLQSQVPSHEVPADLIGMHRDALTSAIDDYGWDVRDETTRVDGTEPGEILETRPAAGEMLREGDTLTVVVSEGATLVDLPADLVGMTADDAAAALGAVGLTAEQVPTRSEDVDEGVVIGFAGDDPGGQVPKGSTVRLAVSSGAELPMPDVTGRSHAEAVATLTAAGLDVDVEDESDDSAAPGVVIRTDPEAGEDVEPGDTVTVVVAFTEVDVPDIAGDRYGQAARKIEDAGLAVGNVAGPRDGRVLATWPLEGTEVPPGSTVDLVMRPR